MTKPPIPWRKIFRQNAMVWQITALALLAAFVPGLGAKGGPLHPEHTTGLAVAVIFFFQGLLLPTEAIVAGLSAWRLHLLTQGSIFLLAPLYAWLMTRGATAWLTPDFRMSLLFLSVLPTTVATAPALTAQSRGNVVGALFNTCLSNLAGILIVPLAVAFFARVGAGEMSALPLIRSIALQLLLPLVIGQGLRCFLGSWAARHRTGITRLNSWLILFMLFVALCQAVAERAWAVGGLRLLALAAGGAILLLGLMMASTLWAGRLCGLSREDRMALFFCGSQKTLAAGVPMAQIIFAHGSFATGIILLPLLIYSPLQLSVGAILASRWESAMPPVHPPK